MTNRHRTFKLQKVEPRKKDDKIGFDLGDQSYTCKDAVQGAVILDFVSAADAGNAKAAAKILEFFDYVLTKKDRKRLQDQIFADLDVDEDDEDAVAEVVPMETLGEIVGYLIEQYTDRDTAESE